MRDGAQSEPVPEASTARESSRESGDVAPIAPFDPRQGTLLGFELPDDALASMTGYWGTAQTEPSVQSDSAGLERGRARPGQKAADSDPIGAAAAPVGPEKGVAEVETTGGEKADDVGTTVAPVAAVLSDAAVADAQPAVGEPAQPAPESNAAERRTAGAKPAGFSGKSGTAKSPRQAVSVRPASTRAQSEAAVASAGDPPLGSTESKPLSPGAALASLREQAERRPPPPARPPAARPAGQAACAGPAFPLATAPIAVSASSAQGDAPRESEPSPSNDLAATVTALQEALLQERGSAQDRWRRTRRWLAVTLVGLAVLFAVTVAQTVALVSFSHRAQAAAQQTQSALNDQRAALAGLASSTSALAARIDTPARPDTASGTLTITHPAPRLAKHGHGHGRHAEERIKPAPH